MKIKELHLKNIASIETADIDFEKGLNDGITGDPASIFLITGDTGAGKSVILDGIAMALYKTTPRLTGVNNTNNNEFINAEGERVRVSSLEQYTRLGISENTPSYSMVLFEGNDGQEYTARLSLGLLRGNTNKEGKRPLKYRTPKWEVKIGNADFTTDSVEQTILNAVGLTFEQFGRMAMLAQGQFAAFLTGDKAERSEILEQLTYTQHFSAYGDAITRLFSKAKADREGIQIQLNEANANPLAQTDTVTLGKESEQLLQDKQATEQQISKNSTTLQLVESILQNEAALATASTEKQRLENLQKSEAFLQSKSLVERWDATHLQRQQLEQLQSASRKKNNALAQLSQLRTTFVQLSADLEHRIQQAQQQDDRLFQLQLWLEERKDRDALYTQHGEHILKMRDYLSKTTQLQTIESQLKDEQGKTENLKQKVNEATEILQKALKEVNEKQQAIDTLTQQRAALNPDLINSQLTQTQGRKNHLEILQKTLGRLAERQQALQQIQQEIDNAQQDLKDLEAKKKEAEVAYQTKKTADDEAKQRLNTMKMSVSDTLVELRKRLHQERSTTCPLCGQTITRLHLDEEFLHLLTPLEAEQQNTASALRLAEQQRDRCKSAFDKADGELNGKRKSLENEKKQLRIEQDKALDDATQAGLDRQQDLTEQIPGKLETLEQEINRLKAAQKEAEELQKSINQLLAEKKPLEETKSKAEKNRQQAQSALETNQRDILRLLTQSEELKTGIDTLEKDLNTTITGSYPEWKTNVEATCLQLRQEAETYLANKTKYEKDKTALEAYQSKNDSIRDTQQRILSVQPQWKEPFNAVPYPTQNISNEWTNLLTNVNSLMASVTDCDQTILENQTALTAYYAETNTNQTQLETLIEKAQHIDPARRSIHESLTALKSNNDAIARYQQQIEETMAKLGLSNRDELPEKTLLVEEGKILNEHLLEVVGNFAKIEKQLKDYADFHKHLKGIEDQLAQSQKVYNKWERLNKYFGGKRFRVLVQTYILRPLLNNANLYLEKITDRYTLTCSEDNEQLAILVLDRYNKNQVRSVTVLSGGERFMISLALSLALSSLNRPDMNVNILFIDEGFGTLDEHCLHTVMSTLEKLQEIAGQSNRRVGIISHREELDERIPVKIRVEKQGEGRSFVKIEKNG